MGAALRPAFSPDTPSDVTAKACEVIRQHNNNLIKHCFIKDKFNLFIVLVLLFVLKIMKVFFSRFLFLYFFS